MDGRLGSIRLPRWGLSGGPGESVGTFVAALAAWPLIQNHSTSCRSIPIANRRQRPAFLNGCGALRICWGHEKMALAQIS
jgi:hypothetical protein